MDVTIDTRLVIDLLTILLVGFVSGAVFQRFRLPTLVGYLIVGALIGQGGLELVTQENREIEHIARAGVLFLLFSIGLEFSLEELSRMSRYFFIGGTVQMLLVAGPVIAVCLIGGAGWQAAVLIGSAAAFSSTVLVFKALAEYGETGSPHGKRAIGILLFQDAALVPLMFVLPLLTGIGEAVDARAVLLLILNSALFVVTVVVSRSLVRRWMVPILAALRSTELMVLFVLLLLGGTGLAAYAAKLPTALGAFAAGLMLSGNRLTPQIDALLLPFRETFAAVFFVSVGMLMQPLVFFDDPLLLSAGLLLMLVLKSAAAAVALKVVGLPWKVACGMGVGLAQLGEFSFILFSEGLNVGLVEPTGYNRVMFIALGSLILTPLLLRVGLKSAATGRPRHEAPVDAAMPGVIKAGTAIVVGLGPIGRHTSSFLELKGVEVCLIDLSPVNLYEFAQQGFRTVTGDAADPEVLARAGADRCQLAVVSVPNDEVAIRVTRAIRDLNADCTILVRCRYLTSVAPLRSAGATRILNEEQEVTSQLVRLLDSLQSTGNVAPG